MPAARPLATILLLVSLVMFGILVKNSLAIAHGGHVPAQSWGFPLTILATGAVLMTLLARRQISIQLYLAAFALWLLTTGYYVALSM